MLKGKDVVQKDLRGIIVELSKNCAEIILSTPIDVLTNLKMSVVDVDEKLSTRNFYGKVTRDSGEKRRYTWFISSLYHRRSMPIFKLTCNTRGILKKNKSDSIAVSSIFWSA